MEREKVDAQLDSVTDHVEEKSIDAGTAAQLAQMVTADEEETKAVAKPKIKIPEADVKMVMAEFECDRDTAEKTLRKAEGNMVEALSILVNN